MPEAKSITSIVESRLCLGCGACQYVCPENNITLVNVLEEGIRPSVKDAKSCLDCERCLSVCPGYETDLSHGADRPKIMKDVYTSYGPILEIWEGHAVDEEIRFEGSSGGALTALSLYCLEQENMSGVMHIGQDPDNALANKTRLSTSRQELLHETGSRYAPASACDSLNQIERAAMPCVFIGQPSEVAAYRKAQRENPALDKKTGLVLSFFCAGTPSQQGTRDLLERFKVPADKLTTLRYRGRGWPGFFTTATTDSIEPKQHLSYRETWGFLRSYRPLSTYLFPDSSGEDADISCGDPWYHEVKTSNSGSSLIVVRTENGRTILRGAIEKGYIIAEPRTTEHLKNSQGSLAKKRGEVLSRLIACKLMFLQVPRLKGFSLYKNWKALPVKDRLRSIASTFKRARRGKYHTPFRFDPQTGKTL